MDLPDLRIEPATESDVPLILSLIKALAEYERMSAEVTTDEEAIRASLFGPTRSAEAAIARVGAHAVGFAVWFHNYSTFLGRRGLYLEDVFVLPEWRSRGIGRALLVHLAQIAAARGCLRMEWSVLRWNESAIAFYRGLGATPMDDWTVYRLTGEALASLAGPKRV
ncbi:MAG TPA: GNAT family N-acetyltransferase [Vicinamibacterales bacterium]|nr:GNAT family N-acetyltransferase [Vicinamibacterales bacterium]